MFAAAVLGEDLVPVPEQQKKRRALSDDRVLSGGCFAFACSSPARSRSATAIASVDNTINSSIKVKTEPDANSASNAIAYESSVDFSLLPSLRLLVANSAVDIANPIANPSNERTRISQFAEFEASLVSDTSLTAAQCSCVARQLEHFLPVAICRPLLFDALDGITDQAPSCVVVATLGACWIAAKPENARKPVSQPPTVHMYLNSKKVKHDKDQCLVVAHPLGSELLEHNVRVRAIPAADVATYFAKLIEKTSLLEHWGWKRLTDALGHVAISEVCASVDGWSSATIAAVKETNGSPLVLASFNVVHNKIVPPARHVVVAPHAERGRAKRSQDPDAPPVEGDPKAWSWPEFIDTD